ncbi:hypothetical protein [Microbacterium sp. KNMS]
MTARAALRARRIAELDAMLEADDYNQLDREEATYARLTVRDLSAGKVEDARRWAELATAAAGRIEELFRRRKQA